MNLENKQLLKGIALMLGAMSVVPMLDVIAKILSESYPVMQISWARFAFHTLWLLPLLYWQKAVIKTPKTTAKYTHPENGSSE